MLNFTAGRGGGGGDLKGWGDSVYHTGGSSVCHILDRLSIVFKNAHFFIVLGIINVVHLNCIDCSIPVYQCTVYHFLCII